MTAFVSPSTKGSIPYNGINVKYIDKVTKQETWKVVFEDEARKVNPLHDVNVTRNELVLDSVDDGNWTDYHEFEAKQHPAWYEKVNGEWKQNKVYYGNLIEEALDSLQEARVEGNSTAIETFEKELKSLIKDFKQAPGAVPYVVGFNHTAELAQQYGVSQVSDNYYDSQWNSELVNEEGKFKTNMWYENPYLVENEPLKKHIESLVKDIFPTSQDTPQVETVEEDPELVQEGTVVTPKPNEDQFVPNPVKEPVEKTVTPNLEKKEPLTDTPQVDNVEKNPELVQEGNIVTPKPNENQFVPNPIIEPVEETVIPKLENEAPLESPALGGQTPEPQFSIASTLSEFLIDEVKERQENNNNVQALYLQNLKFDFKPNKKVVQELYS